MKAKLIGKSKLLDVPNETFDLWNCNLCGNLFHTSKKLRGRIVECINCKRRVRLDDSEKEDNK